MRCPDCNKFVGYGEGNVDDINIDVSGDTLEISGRIVLPCGECGTELKECQVEETISLTDHFGEPDGAPDDDWEAEYEVVDSSADFTERSQDTDRHGKVITKARYRKTFYGADIHATVKRTATWKSPDGGAVSVEDEATIDHTFEEQASGFSELT